MFPCRYSTTRWVNPLQKALSGKAPIYSHRSRLEEQSGKGTNIHVRTACTYAGIRKFAHVTVERTVSIIAKLVMNDTLTTYWATLL